MSDESRIFPQGLVERMRAAQHLVVFTGAGVSAESGIPTFRDALTGLWQRFDPMELATVEAFEADPALVWGWYEWRRRRVLGAQPNAAHRAIAKLESQVPRLTLITQNVDDLHERAGSDSVLHLHGSLFAPRCFQCTRPYAGDLLDEGEIDQQRVDPHCCAHCGGKIRPGVVWFGENLPERTLTAAFEAAGHCDLLLSIGTSGVVYPAAQVPSLALQGGATVVHINPQPVSVAGEREFSLVGAAGEVLPALVRQVFGVG